MNYFLLIFPAVMWGTLGAFVRQIPLTSAQIALIRTILAAITLSVIYLFGKSRFQRDDLRRNLPRLALAGFAMAFNWIALFEAYKLTSVSVATVVYYLAPALVIAASPFLYKEKLTRNKLLGLLSALVGMGFVSLSAGVGEVSVLGIAMAFGGAVLYAIVTLTNKSITGLSGLQTSLVEFFFAVAVLTPYTLFCTDATWQMPNFAGVLSLATIGIFHTGICYAMYFSAVQKLPAQTSAICSFADPFSALFVSFFLLGESISAPQIMGAILIIGGALLAELKSNTHSI